MTAFTIICSIVAGAAVAFIIGLISFFICNRILTSIQKKYNDFVLQNSIRLKQLEDINSCYNFYPDINFDQTHKYDNETFYNEISCQDYLIYQLQYIQKSVYEQIKNIKENKQIYSQYLAEIKNIEKPGQFYFPDGKLKLHKLIKIEERLVKKRIKKSPATELSINVTLLCSTINGHVYNKKSQSFSQEEITSLIKKLCNKNGHFYNDREIWDAICRVERGKVSNIMRFSIYERDGYKCCKCGATADETQLEIDHIIPISKGGKSTYDNLQTLCHKCNVEKGNKLG